jgi:hypothetical protein
MSQESEKTSVTVDLLALNERGRMIETLDLVPFGPCLITPEAWRSLRLCVRIHSTRPEPRETEYGLLGRLHDTRFVVTQAVEIITQGTGHCVCSEETIKKIEEEGNRERLSLVGFLRAHCDERHELSLQERIAWLSLMFEFNRPLTCFVITPGLKLAAYSISLETFLLLKDAIRFVPIELKE